MSLRNLGPFRRSRLDHFDLLPVGECQLHYREYVLQIMTREKVATTTIDESLQLGRDKGGC